MSGKAHEFTAPVRAADAESDKTKTALAWLHSARFLTTASELDQLPAITLPEIAFVGRSNAGKSTAINVLTQHKRLAFASKTPGRTQHINLFEVGPKLAADAVLADLPGYGYAAVARDAKRRWQEVMSDYLHLRRNLEAIVLLVDSRLGLTDSDRTLLDFVSPRVRTGAVRLIVLLTKADKLNRSQATAATNQAAADLQAYASDEAHVFAAPFSALRGTGVGDAAALIAERRAATT